MSENFETSQSRSNQYILLKEQCQQPEGKEKGVEGEEKLMTKSETK